MENQRKHSGLPPRPPRHPQSSNATDGASSSRGRSKKQIFEEEETEKKYGQFNTFLKSISLEKKRSDFLVIPIQELRDYLSASLTNDSRLVLETFDEAIEFGQTNKNDNEANWGFWVCPSCNNKFTNDALRVDHLEKHLELQKTIASEIRPPPARWIEMVVHEAEWKPVDVNASLRMIEDNQQLSDDELMKLELPLSDDKDRASLLEKVRERLKDLITTGSFPHSNLTIMMRMISEELKVVFPKSKHEAIERIAQLGLGFRFLKAPPLGTFIYILVLLAGECDKVEFLNHNFLDNYFKRLNGKTEIEEKLYFSKDGSSLVLDERLLTPAAIVPQRYLLQDASVSGFPIDDPLGNWLLCSAPVREEIELWALLKGGMRGLGTGFVKSSDSAGEKMESWAQQSTRFSEAVNQLYSVEAIFSQEEEDLSKPTLDDERYESLIRGLPEPNSDELETVIRNARSFDASDVLIKISPWDAMRKWLVNGNKYRIALRTRIKSIALQKCTVDSNIQRMASIQSAINDKFEMACRLDYRAILLPFVKSFLEENFFKQITEEAKQKSDAAYAELMDENKKQDEKKSKANKKTMTKQEKAMSVPPLLEVGSKEAPVPITEDADAAAKGELNLEVDESGMNDVKSASITSAVEVPPEASTGQQEESKFIRPEWMTQDVKQKAAESAARMTVNRDEVRAAWEKSWEAMEHESEIEKAERESVQKYATSKDIPVVDLQTFSSKDRSPGWLQKRIPE